MSARISQEPTFTMPTCHKHFFKGYRWWCKKCSAQVEGEFRTVCEWLWKWQRAYGRDLPAPPSQVEPEAPA